MIRHKNLMNKLDVAVKALMLIETNSNPDIALAHNANQNIARKALVKIMEGKYE